ncbi:MAG: hypothetical protein R3A48_20215 [Polyangiales bacterium]
MSAWLRRGAALALAVGCGARSELSLEREAQRSIACGAAPVDVRAGRGAPIIASVPASFAGALRWEVLDGGAATVTAAGRGRATFFTELEGVYRVRASSADPAVDIGACVQTVRARGTAPGVTCGPGVTTLASETAELFASVRSAEPIERSAWSLLEAPEGSARPAPLGSRFVPDVVGDFVTRFEAVDAQGERDACELTVTAEPGPGLRVELWWDPPGVSCADREGAACDRADLDLHVLRAGRDGWGSSDDCHFANCNASAGTSLSWDGGDGQGDPRLLRDDVSGHGPEVVGIRRPASGTYRVGAHYFESHASGAQRARLAVHCGGVTTAVGPRLLPPDADDRGAFWLAAEVVVDGASCAVRALTPSDDAALPGWNRVRGRDGP